MGDTIGQEFMNLFLNHYLPTGTFTIMVVNNMLGANMINPMVYLDSGETITPPPFKIPSVEEAGEGALNLVIIGNTKPAGR